MKALNLAGFFRGLLKYSIITFVVTAFVIGSLFLAGLILGDPPPIEIHGVVYEWIDAPEGEPGRLYQGYYYYPDLPADFSGKQLYFNHSASITFWTAGTNETRELGFQEVKYADEFDFNATLYSKPIPTSAVIKVELPGYRTLTGEFPIPQTNPMRVSMTIFLVKEG
jgi:hypothetical protein